MSDGINRKQSFIFALLPFFAAPYFAYEGAQLGNPVLIIGAAVMLLLGFTMLMLLSIPSPGDVRGGVR